MRRPTAWRRFAERHGLVPRASAEAWDLATTPALIAEGRYRRIGAGTALGPSADRAACLAALARAPGWTAATLEDTWQHLPRAQASALQATAQNPSATMAWFTTACRWSWKQALPTAFWVEAWVDRLTGPTPPRDGLRAPEAIEMLLLACAAMPPDGSRNPRELNGQALLDRVVTAGLARPSVTDEDLAALGRLLAAWQARFSSRTEREYGLAARLAQILHHPAAGSAVRAMWLYGAQHHPFPLFRWATLPTLRPDWLHLPEVRAAIDALTPVLHSVDETVFYAYATPAVAAAHWNTQLMHEPVDDALASLAFLPPAALAALPLTTTDIAQCLAHAATAATRLALIAALPHLPITRGDTPATVLVATSPYADLPAPVLPPTLAAHHPAIQAWLATQDPAYRAFRDEVVARRHHGVAAHLIRTRQAGVRAAPAIAQAMGHP